MIFIFALKINQTLISQLNPKVMQVSENIRTIREIKKFKQEHMADKLGISITAYSKLESGETMMTPTRLQEIAKILDVEPDFITKFDTKTIFNVQNSPQSAIGTNPVVNITDKFVKHLEDEVTHLRSEVARFLDIIASGNKPIL